jgi:acyl carrier protein
MEEKLKQLMADILNIDVASIDESTAIDNVASWDSMSHLNICLAIEREFDVSFDVAEMEGMISYNDILQTVSAKL